MVVAEGVRMLDRKDIAAMKLDAVTKRGSKKDFYDIYFLIRKMSLPTILDLYNKKFQHSTLFHVLKSLTYFEDAEEQPNPIVFDKKLKWADVKIYIEKEVRKIFR